MKHAMPGMKVLVVVSAMLMAQLALPQDAPPSTAAPETAVEAPPAPPPELVEVLISTGLGEVRVALEKTRAPITVANFLRYADAKRFDGATFYRAVKMGEAGEYGLVQGGLRGDPKRVFKPIAHESPAQTGLTHTSGTISMARTDPGTAKAEFFFVIGDLVSLDGKPAENDPGYAAFGHVVSGMEVLKQMQDLPRDPNAKEPGMSGQILAVPVKILSVRRAPQHPEVVAP
jgi:peptidyl-prolyl cis-trans isomerase A (cyclophilin A)